MQNLPNITPREVVAVGGAVLVLCVAPAMLAWSDARRRRRALRTAAAPSLRDVVVAPPEPAAAVETPHLIGVSELWDEPTVTVPADAAALPPPATWFEAAAPPRTEVSVEPRAEPPAKPPPVAVVVDAPAVEAPPAEVLAAPPVEPVLEPPPAPPAEPATYQFCLQELRRVRLPNWPPSEVSDDAARSERWRAAERLAAEYREPIGATRLAATQPVQSSCLGSTEADATVTRLHFLLFPLLWPATAAQAVAEAVFEVEPATGAIRSWVRGLRPAS